MAGYTALYVVGDFVNVMIDVMISLMVGMISNTYATGAGIIILVLLTLYLTVWDKFTGFLKKLVGLGKRVRGG